MRIFATQAQKAEMEARQTHAMVSILFQVRAAQASTYRQTFDYGFLVFGLQRFRSRPSIVFDMHRIHSCSFLTRRSPLSRLGLVAKVCRWFQAHSDGVLIFFARQFSLSWSRPNQGQVAEALYFHNQMSQHKAHRAFLATE